ncbi:uncharacterized protein L3040_004255 [Drepanopeziza brunnea f. sp. 'multigermtubi']|uniref:uncharacterized protein n=1 Tax=Drepanopeziza brunnea f. sp. 'multigermtubi' TaxID=698441 RepID=UPI00238D766C|nr:hypothetical protein L3040_004255 [Drepanopeziza brunnea f. sp. 'multigermtubi']
MAHSHTMLSIAQILGLFFCAHHFWPKGTTYRKAGGDWEKSYRRRHAQGHSRSNKRGGETGEERDIMSTRTGNGGKAGTQARDIEAGAMSSTKERDESNE